MDTAKPSSETRPVQWVEFYRAMGVIRVWCHCPFCHTRVEGYVWSISGCGRRCLCGAKLLMTSATKEKSA